MNKRLVTVGLAAAAITIPLLPTTAQAAGSVSVTSPSCGSIKLTNTTSLRMIVALDIGHRVVVNAHSAKTLSGYYSGTYVYTVSPDGSEWVYNPSYLTVRGCAGVAKRPVEGDQNGDGRADVLGIQARTGDLYYYRMTATGLASGIKAGHGWNNMVFMQQTNELYGGSSGNYLVAVRNDGTVWRYDNKGYGRFANGTQIGSGLKGYDNFAISQLNSPPAFGARVLMARKGNDVWAWVITPKGLDPYGIQMASGWSTTTKTISLRDFTGDAQGGLVSIRQDGTMWFNSTDGDPYGEVIYPNKRQVGRNWGAMATVTSPGSLDGDRLSDLVARRSDGNLYKYINRGGVWGPAVKIGKNWQAIRLLA